MAKMNKAIDEVRARSPSWAGSFLDRWCTKVMRSRIEPMKKIAATLRNHRPLILNWFRAAAGGCCGWDSRLAEPDPQTLLRRRNSCAVSGAIDWFDRGMKLEAESSAEILRP